VAIPRTQTKVYVDCIYKVTIQKSGFDINLLGDKTIRSDDGQAMYQAIENLPPGQTGYHSPVPAFEKIPLPLIVL
jgi:hypothetical protein